MRKDKKLTEKLSGFVSSIDATKVVMTPLFIGFIGLAGLMFFPDPKTTTSYVVWMSFWSIVTGIAIILKREIPRPGHRSIKGVIAVVLGILWVILFGIVIIVLCVAR